VAARIAGLAGGGEILTSAEALAEAGDVATTDAREVEVRGVSTQVRVASIVWTESPPAA
jgi:class 3 adenylate cyclase